MGRTRGPSRHDGLPVSELLRDVSYSQSALGTDWNSYSARCLQCVDGTYVKELWHKENTGVIASGVVPVMDRVQYWKGTPPRRWTWDEREVAHIRTVRLRVQLNLARARELRRPEWLALLSLTDVLDLGGRGNWRVLDWTWPKVVFHAVSAIERVVAPTARLFDAVLSPFRDLDAARRVARKTPRYDACLGFWFGARSRVRELDLCADAAAHGECYLPSLDSNFDTIAVGPLLTRSTLVAKLLLCGKASAGWPTDE